MAFQACIYSAYLGILERSKIKPIIETQNKIIGAIGVSYAELFSDTLEFTDHSERDFYLDMVCSILSALSDEELKVAAEAIAKIIGIIG